jgi:hypothetical protein
METNEIVEPYQSVYCIVQETPTDNQHMLGLLLSIELYNSDSTTCVICCLEETKKYIKAFPKNINLKLDFIIIDPNEKFNCLNYIKNNFCSLKYCVNKYGECLLVGKDLIMTNKMYISNATKEQGIGFIKKTCSIIDDASEFQRYSISLFYLNQAKFVDTCIESYESNLKLESLYAANFDDYDEAQIKYQTQVYVNLYARLPLHLIKKCDITYFLNDYSYVGSEDFFAYDNSIKMTDITKELTYKENLISFCNIRTATLDKRIQQLNTYFLNMLINKHIVYMSLLNMKLSDKKVQFITPKRNAIGIWNRTNDCGGMYELIDLFIETYSEYSSKVEVEIDYFSIGNLLLTDKPAHIWLNNSIKKYSKLFLCNYDQSLVDILPTLPIPSSFLFYYSYFPKALETFLTLVEASADAPAAVPLARTIEHIQVCPVFNTETNDLTFSVSIQDMVEEPSVDFQTLLEKLMVVKYGVMEKFDMNLMATYLALGVVPVILSSANITIYDLEENVHYITAKITHTPEEYQCLQNNGRTYYQEHIKPSAALAKLFDHIFVRNI